MGSAQDPIRAAVRRARGLRSASEAHASAAAISAHLLDLPSIASAACVAAFAPLPGEPDIWPALEQLRARGCEVLLPRVTSERELHWGAYDGPEALAPGAWGVREPIGHADRSLGDAEVIVVPALAVDPSTGARIGYGGGFFDTALATIPRAAAGGPLRVAPCFDDEVIVDLPANDWDARVDCVVTPTRVIHI